MKLKNFKTYTNINLANYFIQSSKFFIKAFILIVEKLNNSFHLHIYYWDLNSLTIKNYYLLILISKLFNQ